MFSKPLLQNIAKHTKLIADSRGIYKRFLHEANHWQNHLTNCKNYISKYLLEKSARNIVILGSGWLLDIPVEDMLKKAEKIQLIDIVHPPEILHKYKKEPKCHFIQTDITGGLLKHLYTLSKSKNFSLTNMLNYGESDEPFNIAADVDMVISLNLLSQLNGLIIEYLKNKYTLTENDLLTLSKHIQENHLAILPKNKSIIITDTEEIISDMHNHFIKKNPLIFTVLPNLKDKREWIWEFDTQGTYYPHKKTHMKVIAGSL